MTQQTPPKGVTLETLFTFAQEQAKLHPEQTIDLSCAFG